MDWAEITTSYNYLGPDYVSEVTFVENIDKEIARYFTKRQHELDTQTNFYRIKSSISEITVLAWSFKVITK